MKLFCPDCGAPISAGDVNLASLTAKCRACNSIFTFDATGAEHRVTATAPLTPPALIPRPPGLELDEFADNWAIQYRWFSPMHVFLLVFCVAWDGFLVFWYSMAFKEKAPWIMVVFPVVHLAVGIGLTYTTLCGFLNRTRIEVQGHALSIRHGPLPWSGNRVMDISDLRQIFCERSFSRNQRNYNQSTSVTFNLSATMRDGTKLKLLSGFTEPDRPWFIEQQLERKLGIAPERVAGEFAPGSI